MKKNGMKKQPEKYRCTHGEWGEISVFLVSTNYTSRTLPDVSIYPRTYQWLKVFYIWNTKSQLACLLVVTHDKRGIVIGPQLKLFAKEQANAAELILVIEPNSFNYSLIEWDISSTIPWLNDLKKFVVNTSKVLSKIRKDEVTDTTNGLKELLSSFLTWLKKGDKSNAHSWRHPPKR